MLVVAVHGISQQFKADSVIHEEWWPALRGGLRLAGGDLSNPKDITYQAPIHPFGTV